MIVKLKRKRERKMRRCFTRFPFGELVEPNIYQNLEDLAIMWEDCGGVTDCEEFFPNQLYFGIL